MPQPVGIVTKVSGESYAISGEKTRFLAVGSSFFASDVLVTKAGANLELIFYDESVVSLGASSRVEVKEFIFDAEQKVAPSFVLHMLEGVVRSVSGKVVAQNPEGFKLSSPLATISIRGTETLHIISPTNEIHSVVSLGAGHTVVLNTPDGRAIVISDSLQGLKLALDDLSPLQLMNISPELLNEYMQKLHSEGSAKINPQGVFVFADAEFLNSIANVGFITNSVGFLAIEQLDNLLSVFDLENSVAGDLVDELFTGDALMVGFLESNTPDLIESPQVEPDLIPPDLIPPDPIEPDPIIPDPIVPLAPAPPGQTFTEAALTVPLYGDTSGSMTTHGASDTITITGTMSGFGTVLSGDAGGNISGAGVLGGNDVISVSEMTSGSVYGDAAGEINNGARGGNDTITVSMMFNWGTEVCGDAQFIKGTSVGGDDSISIEGAMTSTSVYGDAVEMFDSSRGGNDTLMITGYFTNSGTKVFGDAWNMHNSSVGGNDIMTIVAMSEGAVSGDANNMSETSVGGNDTIFIWGNMTGGSVYGDAANTMDNSSRGGNDSITVEYLIDPVSAIYGDASIMNDSSRGGNDVITLDSMSDGTVSGDAMYMLGSSVAGNDTITIDYLSGGDAYGDAYGLGTNAKAGNDFIQIGNMSAGNVYGDADLLYSNIPGGNDSIHIGEMHGGTIFGGVGNDTITIDSVYTGTINLYGGYFLLDADGYPTLAADGYPAYGANDGNDTFVFKGAGANSTITIKDFGQTSGNTDILNFHDGWTSVTNAQSGGDWHITATSGTGTLIVVLEGIGSFNSSQLIL